MMRPILTAKELAIGYGKTEKGCILRGLNFDIYPGDMICLMGHNGCGKTTLLRTISRLTSPIHGQIKIRDRNIFEYGSNEFAGLLSVVLTDKIDMTNMSVFEVVALGRYPHTNMWGKLTRTDKKIIMDSLEILGIVDLAGNQMEELSDGQRQKVFVARSLAQDTPILLLDEPTTYLDLPGKLEILRLLGKIVREKKVAVLFSSHDWQLVLEMVGWIWLVGGDNKLRVGVPEDLILSGDFENCFRHDKFIFNRQTALFQERKEQMNHVCLCGNDEDGIIWTGHALKKENFMIDEMHKNDSPLIYVNSSKQGCVWILKKNGAEKTLNSIEDLLVNLKTR